MANEVYESKEYDRLVARKFKPYSTGHQRMYTTAIERIKQGEPHGRMIFEAGFGIGFGLQTMLDAGVVYNYTGCEPNLDSFQYVENTIKRDGVFLIHAPFGQEMADALTREGGFQEAFCIEVIEHVPMHLHLQFLIALRQMAPRLWFSSPDKDRSKEGVRTTKEWTALLRQAKFESIDVDTSNWTYLYECR